MIFPKLPSMLFLKFAIVGLLMAVSYGAGNLHTTERLLREREETGARTMAKNHKEIIAWYAGKMKELRLARDQEAKADAAAYETMQKSNARAVRALAIARADLQKLATTTQQKLAEVRNETANDPAPSAGCILPPSLRQSLNGVIDSINSHPNAGYSEANPARLPDGTDSAIAPVTCLELIGSLTDVLEHDAMLTGWVLSFQQWVSEALR